MGHKHISTLMDLLIPKKTSKERVEDQANTDQTGTKQNTSIIEDRPSYADVVKGKGGNETIEVKEGLIQLR